jgi:CBS domain-containing protein
MFDFDVLKISEAGEADDRIAGISGIAGIAGVGLSGHGGADRPDGDPVGIDTLRLDVRVTDIPRGPALTLSPEAAVTTAIQAMRRRTRGAAVVVQNQRPVGVVTDRDILAQAGVEIDDLRTVPIADVMLPCTEPLHEGDSVGTALRRMCAQRQWHLPIVCQRGLFLGALDIADISLWLRDRLTLISVDAAFAETQATP